MATDGAVTVALRLVAECECPECGSQIQWPVTVKHWVFDAPVASEVCPHCHAGLEVHRQDVETFPVALKLLALLAEEGEG